MPSKKIANPIELRAVIHFDPERDRIEWAKILYVATCEHGINEGRMLPLLHTGELLLCTKDLAEEAVRQLDIHEAIAEEDSLLERYKVPE